MLSEWAQTLPKSDEPHASQEAIERHLRFMAATLPSQQISTETGRARFAVYVSLLIGYSEQAIAYMAREACQTLEWFPVPKVCLALAQQYRPAPGERDATLRICADFMQGAFDRWLANVRLGQPVGDVPAQWPRIAIEMGVLRALDGGVLVTRSLYQAPRRPWPVQKPRSTAKLHIPNAEDERAWAAVMAQQRLEESYGGDVWREVLAWQVDPFAEHAW